MFIRVKYMYVLQFARRDDLQNNGFDPAIENRTRIVWTCSFDAGGSKGGRKHFIQLPISHCDTFEVITLNNRCNFFSVLAVKFIG